MTKFKKIESKIYIGINEVLIGSFFKCIENNKLKKESYLKFIYQKYAGVSYFIPLILNAIKVTGGHSPLLAKVFFENYCDETGIFAGEYRKEYAHSLWREQSINLLKKNARSIKKEKAIMSTEQHNKIMYSLVRSDSPMVVVGGVMFLEHFVVYEMRKLIEFFERDMPKDFIKGQHDPDKFPKNNHEYWYSHATHDVWHYQQIREGLRSYLKTLNSKERAEAQKEIIKGIDIVIKAKKILYSKELFNFISKT